MWSSCHEPRQAWQRNGIEVSAVTLVEDEQSVEDLNGESPQREIPDATVAQANRRVSWKRVIAWGVLPMLAILLASGAGYLKWIDGSARAAQTSGAESVRAAIESTIAMLSYQADTVDKDLGAATERLTGSFKDSYSSLIHDVVIPGAKQKRISAMANVPAAASVSASANHAVVLVFVNQSTTIGDDAPTSTASSVRVTLDKVQSRWLISQFDPV
jgi:Mce-associated membrane protein